MAFKRRREWKTDYQQRLGLLKSGKPRLVVRRSLDSIHVQFILSESAGDKTVVDVMSNNLRKFGWKGHGGNISSAYLVGYLAGHMAAKNGIKEAVVDIGLQNSVKFSSLYAAAAGAKDAGIDVKVNKSVLPAKERLHGKHVADYAEKLKKEDPEKYRQQFSGYLKNEMKPEDLPKHFEEIKNHISRGE
jgi:large subunit ribosomal protein L18